MSSVKILITTEDDNLLGYYIVSDEDETEESLEQRIVNAIENDFLHVEEPDL